MLTSLIALAVSAQLETGAVLMKAPADDWYVDKQLPHSTGFRSVAFGSSLRFDTDTLAASLGWRSLGNQHQNAAVELPDPAYFACRGKSTVPCRPTDWWSETGSERQLFAEAGYKFHVAGVSVVPSVGFADTSIGWHFTTVGMATRVRWTYGSLPDHQLAPYAGLSVERGSLGIGAYYLVTRGSHDPKLEIPPGQGDSALYLRITYRLRLGK